MPSEGLQHGAAAKKCLSGVCQGYKMNLTSVERRRAAINLSALYLDDFRLTYMFLLSWTSVEPVKMQKYAIMIGGWPKKLRRQQLLEKSFSHAVSCCWHPITTAVLRRSTPQYEWMYAASYGSTIRPRIISEYFVEVKEMIMRTTSCQYLHALHPYQFACFYVPENVQRLFGYWEKCGHLTFAPVSGGMPQVSDNGMTQITDGFPRSRVENKFLNARTIY
ncbi:hypothetical protein Anapl_12261 [Anas platyrhynchos]|uniref:Uncharacterized protein n=1 Tax=Anas platyrhynchos TaxID=8839 RepID=R0JRP9_ANAPL|nr:hypothetical protein Anapl_12261 [Anas platyrhynchos]